MAIINRTFGFVFVHIPKCGGTTISHALQPLCGSNDLVLGGTPFGEEIHKAYSRRFNISKHSFPTELRNVVGLDEWPRYSTFATLRDPIERSISTYRYMKHHENHYKFMQEIESFSEHIRSEYWKGWGPDRLFLPQSQWLCGGGNLEHRLVDVVISVSKLGSQLPELLVDCGVPKAKISALRIEQKNKSPETIAAELGADDRAILEERYALDFELCDQLS